AAADLFSLVQDAETGQRGYLLTGNEAFLKPYGEALAGLERTHEQLKYLVEGRPEYERQLNPLFGMIGAKLEEIERTVELARAGNQEEATRLVQEGFGENVMANIRNGMQSIMDLADQNVRIGIEEQLRASDQLKLIILGAGLAIVIVIGGAIYVIMRHVQSLN